jgi:hypothetical protein
MRIPLRCKRAITATATAYSNAHATGFMPHLCGDTPPLAGFYALSAIERLNDCSSLGDW